MDESVRNRGKLTGTKTDRQQNILLVNAEIDFPSVFASFRTKKRRNLTETLPKVFLLKVSAFSCYIPPKPANFM